MKQLIVVPLDASASIDGKWAQQILNLRGAGSSWRVTDVPVIRGRAGLMLRAHDRANGATDYPTPYKLTLYVEGKEEFSAVSNRFNDSLGFHIRIDRDHALMQDRKGEFRKLYRESGNLLETYFPRELTAGELSASHLGGGEKRLLIVAEDLDGNRSLLSMTVMIAEDVTLQHEVDGRMLSLQCTGAPAILLLEEKIGKGWEAVRQWDVAAAATGVTVDLNSLRGKSIRAVTMDELGNRIVQGSWAYGPLKHSGGRLYPRREIHFDEIVYELKLSVPFAAPPRVRITQGDKSEEGRVFPIDDDVYRAVLPTWPGFAGTAEIAVDYQVGGKDIHWTDEVKGFHISAEYGGQVISSDGSFVLSFAPADVYRSLICTLDAEAADSGRTWTVGPQDMPLAGRPVASVLTGRSGSSTMLRADYPVKNYGREQQPNSPAVAGRFGRFLGSYSVLHDDVGPDISVAFALRSREPIRIVIRDSLSGVDWNSISVYIDRALVPVEYDERRDLLVVPYDVYKSIGKGVLTVKAKDRLGNTAVMKKKM
jgi:hypothetical protein